ncbi:MAG: glycosyltransferase [Nitrospirales bacterium]|nr:glycosyltransferase [Nitrospirales bacterium]
MPATFQNQETNLEHFYVVIPAYNEFPTIRDIVRRALRILPNIIVVDDGSDDGTSEALEGLNVTILRNVQNSGKAASLWRGFQYALQNGAKYIITLDGDGQHSPEDIPKLIRAAKNANNCLIIGARTRDWRSIHNPRVLANRIADFWISWAAGASVQDTQSGLRLYPKGLLEKIDIKHGKARSFVFESEVLIKASRLGFAPVCVPIKALPRHPSRKSYFHPVLDVWRITRMVFVQLHVCGFSPIGLYRTLRGRDRRYLPFVVMHLMCLGVMWVGWSWTAINVALVTYSIRMFAITGFYHRYFSHRSFKTSRIAQFIFGVLGASAVQRGPLWWAAHHRRHHQYSDQMQDIHSPLQHGLYWSHMGWFTLKANNVTHLESVSDFLKFPELKRLDRFDGIIPLLFAVALYSLGYVLEQFTPHLNTTGPQMLIWGFFISTVLLYHATYTINSLSHKIGTKRYITNDESGNSFPLALLTFGEGWHNNHHHYPLSARQGFYWWEIDLTYYALVLLSKLGVIWDLKTIPLEELHSSRLDVKRDEAPV